MPIYLEKMLNRTKKINLGIQGETLEVEYFINTVTPNFLQSLDEVSGDASLIKQIETAVKRWDLLDDTGQEIPPIQENLAKLPRDLLNAVLSAIVDDMTEVATEDEKKA